MTERRDIVTIQVGVMSDPPPDFPAFWALFTEGKLCAWAGATPQYGDRWRRELEYQDCYFVKVVWCDSPDELMAAARAWFGIDDGFQVFDPNKYWRDLL
jgi:hypothetical protein